MGHPCSVHASFVRAAITLIAYEFRERCLQCIAGMFLTHSIEKGEVEQNKAANYTTGSLYCTGWRDMAMEHEPCLVRSDACVWAGVRPRVGGVSGREWPQRLTAVHSREAGLPTWVTSDGTPSVLRFVDGFPAPATPRRECSSAPCPYFFPFLCLRHHHGSWMDVHPPSDPAQATQSSISSICKTRLQLKRASPLVHGYIRHPAQTLDGGSALAAQLLQP
jgi:hypothetical protein